MGTLIMFEFKKILGNHAGMVSCAMAFAILVALSVGNLGSMSVRDINTGELVEGFAAQATYRAVVESHAGVLDDERVAQDAAVLDRANQLSQETEGLAELSNQEVIDTYGFEFWSQTRGVIEQDYYREVVGTLESTNPRATSLQKGAEARIDDALDRGFVDYFPYSEAEKVFWKSKADETAWPVTYGYAEGWSLALRLMNLSGLLIVAACIALAGTFAGEYQARTAAVVLPTKRGKRALPLAKVIASFVFVSVYWWVCVLAIVIINVGACGADGWDIPLQVARGFNNPYPLTIGQAMLALCGLGHLIALGMAAFTLPLSAKMRSTMPVAVIPMAIIFLGFLGVMVTPLMKAVAITPLVGLNYAFGRMISYATGPMVTDLPTALAVLYAGMLAALTPLAMRTFRKHQVA